MFSSIIYSCDAKQNFQHHYSSRQSHMIIQKSFYYTDLLLKNISYYNQCYHLGCLIFLIVDQLKKQHLFNSIYL